MIPLDLIHWDAWRAAYDQMTFAEHAQVYDAIHAVYPTQQHYDLIGVLKCLNGAVVTQKKPLRVRELGGWTGTLANHCLDYFEPDALAYWENVEICARARERGLARGRYWSWHPPGWIWDHWTEQIAPFDVCLATHMIEHLSWPHLRALIRCWREDSHLKHLILEAPLPDSGPVAWSGFHGSHLLSVGWAEIITELAPSFVPATRHGAVRLFSRP